MTIIISGSTGISGVDGTVSSPALQGADTDTGVFYPAADQVAIATGGVQRVLVNASGAITTTAGVTIAGTLSFDSGYGSAAVAYGCRAWVNFNGTGTVAIRASGNVSSITDNGTGDYTVNFAVAMPDANYSVSGVITELPATTTGILRINTPLSSRIDVVAVRRDTGVNYDPAVVCVSVFR